MAFVKRGDGKILSVVEAEEMDEKSKKTVKEAISDKFHSQNKDNKSEK